MGTERDDGSIGKTLGHILAYEMFTTSPRAQEFLEYIVTETLAGRSKALTGTTIGQDVFEKGAEFDPIHDSVVRVYARRLRFMLRDYYLEHPKRDPIIITIPKGGYKPLFEDNPHYTFVQDPVQAPIAKSFGNMVKPMAHTLVLLVLISGSLIWIMHFLGNPSSPGAQHGWRQSNHRVSSYPMIAVAPFINETGVEDYDFLEEGLQKKMVEDLSRFRLIRPLVYTSAYETLITEKDRIYDYAFSGIILSVKPELDLYIKLVDIENSTLLFERRIQRSNNNSNYFDSLSEIVSELSGNFAGLEGTIVEKRLEAIEKQIDHDTLKILNLEAFECFGLVGKLLESPSPALYKRNYNCLEALLKEDPNNSTLRSAYGWIIYVGAVSHEPVLMARSINPDIKAEDGIAMMEQAVEIDPNDAWAQQTLSAFKAMEGDIQGALKHAEIAVIANPGDPDNLTSLSTYLAKVGQWDRAMTLAQEALDRNPTPSSHYYYTLFLWGLYKNDAASLQEAAEHISELGDYYSFFYTYLSAVANKDENRIIELQPEIDALIIRNDGDINKVINLLIGSDELRARAQTLLVKGKTLQALETEPID